MKYYDEDHRPPALDCELPEPVRDPEQAMQTGTCQHGTLFLLVDRIDGAEWLEAQPYWKACRQEERVVHNYYYFEEERY